MKDTPLKAVQLLWVNMIMDSLASLALATELPTPILLQRPPYRKKEYIISRRMVKHILGQAIFQACILFTFVFGASYFVPEADPADMTSKPEITSIRTKFGMVEDGMMYNFDMSPHYVKWAHLTPSRHLTIVFNIFVWLQIFNMLCARKINDELNFFEGIHTNFMFIAVFIGICGLQIFIMYGGRITPQIAYAFSVHLEGCSPSQWVISVVCGLATFPINFILKFTPDEFCPVLGEEPADDVAAADKDYKDL